MLVVIVDGWICDVIEGRGAFIWLESGYGGRVEGGWIVGWFESDKGCCGVGGREGIADLDGVVTLVTVAAAEKDTVPFTYKEYRYKVTRI